MISGTFVIVVDDDTREPKKIYAKEVKVLNIEKTLNEKLEIEII